jgi:hypothetical protein
MHCATHMLFFLAHILPHAPTTFSFYQIRLSLFAYFFKHLANGRKSMAKADHPETLLANIVTSQT